MSKRSLLDLTQGILSEMDSDEVNSISDTVEATQIAELIKQVYYDIIDFHDLPFNKQLISLEALGNPDKPTHVRIPESVSQILWIKYDTRITVDGTNYRYTDIDYKRPVDFVTYVNQRPSTDDDRYQIVQETSNIPLVIGRILAPTYWTSFDDEYIVFDSYDQDVDSTIQSSKIICEGSIRPEFTIKDDFVPDLPENLFGLLYSQAKSNAFVNHKEQINPKAERTENRMRIRAQRNKWREGRMINDYPNYGRR